MVSYYFGFCLHNVFSMRKSKHASWEWLAHYEASRNKRNFGCENQEGGSENLSIHQSGFSSGSKNIDKINER